MADVEDRGSAIRVERLTAIPVGAKGYVKIETNMGGTGWGEINNMNTKVACALAESLGEVVIGENPTRIEHLWQRMFRAHRNLRGGGFMMHVISAIDMALWDIAGKLYGVTVYRLLGGPSRDKVWMYPSPQAIKVSPGGARYHAGTPAEVEDLVQRVADARRESRVLCAREPRLWPHRAVPLRRRRLRHQARRHLQGAVRARHAAARDQRRERGLDRGRADLQPHRRGAAGHVRAGRAGPALL